MTEVSKLLRKFLVTTLLLATVLAACNGQTPNNGGNGGGGSNNVDIEEAYAAINASQAPLYRAFVAAGQASIATNGQFPAPPIILPALVPLGSGANAPAAQGFDWSCSGVQSSGDLSDPDHDGIPADAHYTGHCTVSDPQSGTINWTLDFYIADAANDDPLAGFRSHGSVVWEAVGQGKLTWTITHHDVVKQANSAAYDLTYEGGWRYEDYQDGSNDGSISYDLGGTWTPADPNAANFIDLWGSGTLALDGNVTFKDSSCTATADLSFNLHFDASGCADHGSVSYNGQDCDGHACNVSASWQSCNEVPTISGSCN